MDRTIFLSKERLNGALGMRQSGAAEGWPDDRALAELLLEAVREADEMELNPPAPSDGRPALRIQMMRAAWTCVSAR